MLTIANILFLLPQRSFGTTPFEVQQSLILETKKTLRVRQLLQVGEPAQRTASPRCFTIAQVHTTDLAAFSELSPYHQIIRAV